MTHTPGPWVTDFTHPEWARNVVWAGDVVIAHVVDDQHDAADDNARLIAAAPEMLAVLHSLNNRWDEYDEEDSPRLGQRLRDVIAKAEGTAT